MTEMRNVDCSSLGNMLHLEIQKEKEDIKTSIFQKQHWRECNVHEETNDGYKKVWRSGIKLHLLC